MGKNIHFVDVLCYTYINMDNYSMAESEQKKRSAAEAACSTGIDTLEKRSEMELETKREDIYSWEEVILVYTAALRQIETKMEILNDEFQHVHQYNPIEHIKSRIKTPESIVKKLKRNGHESTIENMVKYVNDIAGIRIICSFTSDIYRIADMVSEQRDIKVLGVKDYITFPKSSGSSFCSSPEIRSERMPPCRSSRFLCESLPSFDTACSMVRDRNRKRAA